MNKFQNKCFSGALSLIALMAANPCFAQKPETGVATTGGASTKPGAASKTGANITGAAAAATKTDASFQTRADAFVQQRVRELNIPGYALAVVRDGQVVFRKGYGTTDLDGGSAVNSDTVFGLASVTKTFTALALLALVDQGKISLDDRLDKYVDGLAKSWQPLTIRQLASMTAGVPKAIPKEVKWDAEFKIAQEQPLLFEPGSGYQYSNLSYRTLGTVIEKVTGKKYLEVLHELILDPVGMPSTGTQTNVPAARLAWPFQPQESGTPGKLPPYRNPAIPYAAGMLFSNCDDMIKYAQALMDKKILSPAGYQTMWQDRPPLSTGKASSWAFGWASKPQSPDFGNRFTVSMNGGVPGVASSILIFPEEKVAVISLCNFRKKPVYQVARRVAQMYWGTDTGVSTEEPGEGTMTDSVGEQAAPVK